MGNYIDRVVERAVLNRVSRLPNKPYLGDLILRRLRSSLTLAERTHESPEMVEELRGKIRAEIRLDDESAKVATPRRVRDN